MERKREGERKGKKDSSELAWKQEKTTQVQIQIISGPVVKRPEAF